MKTKVQQVGGRYQVRVKLGLFRKWKTLADPETGNPKTYLFEDQARKIATAFVPGSHKYKLV